MKQITVFTDRILFANIVVRSGVVIEKMSLGAFILRLFSILHQGELLVDIIFSISCSDGLTETAFVLRQNISLFRHTVGVNDREARKDSVQIALAVKVQAFGSTIKPRSGKCVRMLYSI